MADETNAAGSATDWASLGVGIANSGTQIAINAKNRKHAKEMAQFNYDLGEQAANKAFERTEEMWNKSNDYNSASSQRARLEQAGLNPALMYGGAGGGGATSQPTPQAQGKGGYGSAIPAHNPTFSLDSAFALAQLAKLGAEKENIEANTDGIRATTGNTEQQTKNLSEILRGLQFDNDYKSLNYPMQLSLTELAIEFSELQNTGQDISNDIAENNLSLSDNAVDISNATKDSTISRYRAETAVAKLYAAFQDKTFNARVYTENRNAEKIDAEIKKTDAETNKIKVDEKYINQMTAKELKAIDLITAQINNLKIQEKTLSKQEKLVYWESITDMCAKLNIKLPSVSIGM